MPVLAPSTKEQIVRAAERLFAEHGIDGVSMRHIGAASGNRNNSAVQYHFGSKDQLIDAIFEYRLPPLHKRRMLLIAELGPNDLRLWVECQLRAVLEQSELDGSFYMSFVAMLYQHGRRDVFERLPAEFRVATAAFHDRLRSFLISIGEPLRTHRIAQAMALIVQAAAHRERARAGAHLVLPFAVELGDLLDGVVGFLEAPTSPAALAALEGAKLASVYWPIFL
jgi:AcrR family transcriptional regulator